jgi:hypothetical protein
MKKLLAASVVVAFAAVSGPAWAFVGANTVPTYPTVAGSKNKTVTKHGAGPNATPTYTATPASKNKQVIKHGVGANGTPEYAKTGTH